MRGTVSSFDEHVGLGMITTAGGNGVPFHCIAIADGTRVINVGVEVEFELVAKLGRFEATDIRPA
jgi:cold shock CspA family protein